MTAKREKTIEEIIRKLKDARDEYPLTYSDKVYDAVTIDEGIWEVQRYGMRKGLELAISIIETEREVNNE